ncbi:ketopantoate reductase family protein [Fructilactobacillus fructivorans]|uniref:2-dehydropantoate 2-reductase n=1 Tax=Fructilactobacillus fructivorans TaxID=1614 RepID=A0AAE6NZF9_9LACO|nr:2-dehydropantoate 2-reductase [Fructilactobacillus fructivorans]KRK58241.1 2-dehydropantoate 2-reductase [Fructilactobacillus fructivorans]QFX92229.1 2-dehydropantoate 2-reductase [Fructilactobacillus fructivorans]RDV65278.1 2-dehydropantoate 2-reductase [Fructilactobacillus fructivorans]
MKIAIYGAGSLGTIIGAYLTKAYGKDHVDLIADNPQHIKDLNEKGATVTGTANFTVPVSAKTPDELKLNEYDLVLLLTKQTHNDEVLPKVKEVLKPDGTLVSLQNGVPEIAVSKVIDPKNIVAGSVEFGGTQLNHNESELTTAQPAFENAAFQIGELDGKGTDRIKQVQAVLNHVGGTAVSDNLLGTKWSKLLVNSSFSGLSAASDATFGQIADSEIGLKAALNIVNEGLKVGHADGVKFAKMGNHDLSSLSMDHRNDESGQLAYLRSAMANSKDLKASMLQDLEKGHKTEVNDINGVIADTGKKYGIKTPFNDLIIKIVSNAQDTGKLPQFDDTMTQFQKLLDNK